MMLAPMMNPSRGWEADAEDGYPHLTALSWRGEALAQGAAKAKRPDGLFLDMSKINRARSP